jgi:hypothetical protein
MLDFSGIVLSTLQNTFSRPIVISPVASQPGVGSYNARGVFSTSPIDFIPESNIVFSDQKTMVWVRMSEYPILPIPGDQLSIPTHIGYPAEGPFEIIDTDRFADGKMIISLKKLVRQ